MNGMPGGSTTDARVRVVHLAFYGVLDQRPRALLLAGVTQRHSSIGLRNECTLISRGNKKKEKVPDADYEKKKADPSVASGS